MEGPFRGHLVQPPLQSAGTPPARARQLRATSSLTLNVSRDGATITQGLWLNVLPLVEADGHWWAAGAQGWNARESQGCGSAGASQCSSPPPQQLSTAVKLIISPTKISADVLRRAQSPSTCGTGGAGRLLSNSLNKWTTLPFSPLP